MALETTSRLSPHLHFGEISPWQAWHWAGHALTRSNVTAATIEKFRSELGWREFSYYLLYHFPELPNREFRHEFAHFPWHQDAQLLQAWQHGRTGYPIVDAGMRELWQTGWMHNRVRMVVASFLTKHLLQDWRCGADWFWDTLVDADLANNSASWQWVAGCGCDALPYFRIFNPILQSQKFDPDGHYIHQFVPELRQLPAPWLHQPWNAPSEILTLAKVTLGKTYPYPIVDHSEARKKALFLYQQIRNR
jgi:deoxyribodipyrimidine photo-lyase